MAKEPTTPISNRRIDRFVNFRDAVIAIAVTLLVLPLAEKAAVANVTNLSSFMNSFGQQLFVFLLSFVVICRFWEVHHDHFNTLETFNIRLFWLNAGWLLSIVLIPFSSELISRAAIGNTVTTAFYVGNLVVTAYFGVAIEWVILHTSGLKRRSSIPKSGELYGLPSAIAMTISFIIALVDPSLGTWSLFLLVPAAYVSKFSLETIRTSDP
jgi:uncharacterized membrane protein